MIRQLFLILLLLATSIYSTAQTAGTPKPEDTISREVRYNTFKKLYVQMRESKSHQIADSISQVFFYKITPDVELMDISKENRDYMAWTKANLSKTEFKTIEEAEKLWGEYETAVKVSIEENKEYYAYLREMRSFEGGPEMQMSFMMKVREDYPGLYKRIKMPYRPKKKDLIPKVGPLKTQ